MFPFYQIRFEASLPGDLYVSSEQKEFRSSVGLATFEKGSLSRLVDITMQILPKAPQLNFRPFEIQAKQRYSNTPRQAPFSAGLF